MHHKLIYIISFLLIFVSCKKETESNLALQHIKVTGAGTTYYSNDDYNLLLQLTDTSKIYTITELKYSMKNIALIMVKYKDRAGAFPVLYNVVTNVAYETLSNMQTEYAEMGKAFMNEFGKHYIRNFHSYLLGNEIEPAWLNYYKRVAANKNSILHLSMSGINAHITYDIPFVLDNINAVQEFYPDFEVYTDFIAATYPEVGLELNKQYGVQNAANVFKLFQIGDLIDGLNGTGFTTHLVIDILRSQSWERGMKIENGIRTTQQMHQECITDFSVRENLIQGFDDAKLLN